MLFSGAKINSVKSKTLNKIKLAMISKSGRIGCSSFWDDILPKNAAENNHMFYTTPLRVVSWNILGDGPKLALSTKHDYCPRHFRLWAKDNPTPSSVDTGVEPFFSSRCERTAETMLALDADIYCLQECLPNMFDDLLAYGPLQNEFIGFHMKDHMVHSIYSFLGDEVTTDNNDSEMDLRSYDHTTTTDVANFANNRPATLAQEEYGNAILLRRSLILDGTVQISWVKSGLFQTIGPQLASTASSKVTGRARKRFLTLDCYGFVAMKLRIRPSNIMGMGWQQQQKTKSIHLNENSNSNIFDMKEPIDALIFGTHLYWNPWDPQVKALQAEVLAQVCNICAQGTLPPTTGPSSSGNLHQNDNKVIPCTVEASKSSEARTSISDVENCGNTQDKKCVVIIGGDFNSVPHFQPEFIETKEELQTLIELCNKQKSMSSDISSVQQLSPTTTNLSTEVKFHILKLPLSFQQSGVFRLLTHGVLEPDHPEHPDTFGRGAAMESKRSRKRKVCGPMYANPFDVTSPNGFQMAYDYHSETLAKNDEGLQALHSTNTVRRNSWPALTTKVPEFEGVIDYIFWNFFSKKSSFEDSNREQLKLFFQQTESLRVPCLKGPIPDESHTSDHLPVGMSFCVGAHFD